MQSFFSFLIHLLCFITTLLVSSSFLTISAYFRKCSLCVSIFSTAFASYDFQTPISPIMSSFLVVICSLLILPSLVGHWWYALFSSPRSYIDTQYPNSYLRLSKFLLVWRVEECLLWAKGHDRHVLMA